MRFKKLAAVCTTAVLTLGLAFVGMGAASATSTNEECVPQEAYTEIIPAVPGVDAVYETVTVKEAGWQRYSWTGGPWESDTAPDFPSGNWQANTASDPHGVGIAGAYFRSKGNSGKGDWFYLEAVAAVTEQVLITPATEGTPEQTIEHEAVICEEEPDPDPYPVCEGSTTLPTSTNLNTRGWGSLGAEYIDGGLHFNSANDGYVYMTLPNPTPLSEMAALSFNATPNYGGILMYNDDYSVNVHYEPYYSNPLWTNSVGILPAGGGGQGSAMSGDFDDLLSNPLVTEIAFWVNGGNEVTLHSLSFNCMTQAFDYEQPAKPESPEPTYGEWSTPEITCDNKVGDELAISREVTTSDYTFTDGQWVLAETTITEPGTYAVTAEDIKALDCPIPVTPEEPKVETPTKVNPAGIDTLPMLGGGDKGPLALFAGLMMAAGLAMVGPRVLRKIRA